MATKRGVKRKKSSATKRVVPAGPVNGAQMLDGFMSAFSAKDIRALEPELAKLSDAMARVDIKGLKADADELMPRQSDIEKAVKEGMAAIQKDQQKSVMPKLTKQQEEELRQQVEQGLYELYTSLEIDEQAIRYNMEQACYTTGIYNDQFYMACDGHLVMLESLKDAKGFTWKQLVQIGRVVYETFGLIMGLKKIWMKPDQYKVAKAIGKCMNNATFKNKTILLITFLSERVDWFKKGKAIVEWLNALRKLARSQVQDLVRAFVDRYPWYQKVALVAQIISTIGAVAVSYGTALFIKIVYTMAAAIEYIQKIIETVIILRRGGAAATA